MQQLLMRESYTVDYAGFWLRLVAMIIDGGILWGINSLITGLWNLATNLPWGGLTQQMIEEGITAEPLWALRVLVFLAILVMYFVGLWAWRGQTPGKWVMRLKVTRFDGSPIGWGGAFLRFCGYVISGVIVFIGFFWIAFDGRRQGIHDKIAETFVIRVQSGKELRRLHSRTGQVQVH